MSIELQPLGVACNLKCTYCYQNPMRDAGNGGSAKDSYDMAAMIAALDAEGANKSGFTVFGGEPLLMPLEDLRTLFAHGKKNGVPMGIQTNATLITEEHLTLFQEFSVGVGVSMDGPEELNDTRWNGDVASTRAMTAKSQAALSSLLKNGISASLIITLTRVNASAEHLPRLVAWAQDLVNNGLRWINLHTLEVDDPNVRAHQSLSPSETVAALQAFGVITGAKVAPLDAYRDLLLGNDGGANCIWHACDPYTTRAVRAVDGQGTRQNCGRTNKDGVRWVKADKEGFERQLALYLTPQEFGGCAGCRFFFACKGECPGTAEGSDWRSRTEHCATVTTMFTAAEAALVKAGFEPISLSTRRPLVESRMLAAWEAGHTMTIAGALAAPLRINPPNRPHGDAPHGDAPHGDHTDAGRRA